ncbi:MAG: hypothetical protein R3318_07045 [Gammaproteobacteria bacterium]|nr:hypothetical protein [Gammaproteobacteria bacterium]
MTTHVAHSVETSGKLHLLIRWLLNDASLLKDVSDQEKQAIDVFRLSVYLLFHAGCLTVLLTGFSLTAVMTCILFYFTRMFFITAFYHRYFSHR